MPSKSLLIAFALAALVASTVKAQNLPVPTQRNLVVVELFQSQGCSSCPPAEANLNAIAAHPGVLALSFGVTYWDDAGWKDTFATQAYTDRQWNYAHYRRRDNVWTPQIYVNGHADLVGSNRAQLEEAVASARSNGPTIAWAKQQLDIGAMPIADTADVWLVRYDPRTRRTPIGGGENKGRTLPQRNVVRELVHLGTWNGTVQSFHLPPATNPDWMTAAWIQVRGGGDILSASIQAGEH